MSISSIVKIAVTCFCGLMALPAMAQSPLVSGTKNSKPLDPMELQQARAAGLKTRAAKIHYTKKFDLSALPEYLPTARLGGTIRQWGSNYLADSMLETYLEEGFRKYHPDVKFENKLGSTFIAMAGLYTDRADIAPMGRRATSDELQAYQRVFNALPLEIAMATGSYDVAGWTFALAIFVHKDNPLANLTIEQLDGIFGAERSGGSIGNEWDPAAARGAEKNIRVWGQLGLKGTWAKQPINVYGYNLNYHFPRDFSEKVMKGGYKWNERMKEYTNAVRAATGGENGKDFATLLGAGEQMIAAVEKDRYGITYTGMLYRTPNVKAVALSENSRGPYIAPTLETVQDRRYPLSREVYYYLHRAPGKAVDPLVAEYVRFVLSREGQEAVQRDGKYLPMTAEIVREQLKKLE